MNPFEVHKIISDSKKNDERLVIEELNQRCGVRLRHAHLIMSQEMFSHGPSGGFPRHWVKGLHPLSYLTLWFYQPPKETDFSPVIDGDDLPSFGDMEKISDEETE